MRLDLRGAQRVLRVHMGGRTASELRDVVLKPLAKDGVQFEFHWLRETVGLESSGVAGLSARGNIASKTHDVRIAVGDDMEMAFDPAANTPITVFKADGSIVTVVEPGPGRTSRDALIELLSQPPPR